MTQATALVETIRRDLEPTTQRLRQHPYIAALADGRIPRAELARFAGEQHAIISSDLRSVAHLVSRFGATADRDFFLDVLAGERTALGTIAPLAGALGLSAADLAAYEPLPGAHAYAAYMAWLAQYATAAEVATAYLVNFPAWGDNCGRISRILRDRYGLDPEAVAFFDFFAAPAPGFADAALAVLERGLNGQSPAGADPRLVSRAARLLQGYELLYWDTLLAAATA